MQKYIGLAMLLVPLMVIFWFGLLLHWQAAIVYLVVLFALICWVSLALWLMNNSN